MIERTVLEIAQHRFWSWHRRHAITPRSQLRETDLLLGLIEECRLRRFGLVPTPIWRRIVKLLGQVDTDFADQLGIDRSLDRASEVLFQVQGLLMQRELTRRASPGKIIPLFR